MLAAGIDVLTTLNVQHLETLERSRRADLRACACARRCPTPSWPRADEVELIDLPTEELIERLRAGKVYVQDQIARAVQNFFSKGNLTALRELAMRAAADRVDAQLREHMRANAIGGPWPAQERILVALTESPVARTLVRTAKRMADRARVEWVAVTVTSARGPRPCPIPTGTRWPRPCAWPNASAARWRPCPPRAPSPTRSWTMPAAATSAASCWAAPGPVPGGGASAARTSPAP